MSKPHEYMSKPHVDFNKLIIHNMQNMQMSPQTANPWVFIPILLISR